MRDIKRKVPWFLSDFKDSLHIQSLASVVFLFLATFTQNVTFGGILGNATDGYMVIAIYKLQAFFCLALLSKYNYEDVELLFLEL